MHLKYCMRKIELYSCGPSFVIIHLRLFFFYCYQLPKLFDPNLFASESYKNWTLILSFFFLNIFPQIAVPSLHSIFFNKEKNHDDNDDEPGDLEETFSHLHYSRKLTKSKIIMRR